VERRSCELSWSAIFLAARLSLALELTPTMLQGFRVKS
jgi:hypothetical protein